VCVASDAFTFAKGTVNTCWPVHTVKFGNTHTQTHTDTHGWHGILSAYFITRVSWSSLKIIFLFIKSDGNTLVSKRIKANSKLYITWSTPMSIFPCSSFRIGPFTSGLWRVRYPDQVPEEWNSSSTSKGARNKKGLLVSFFIFETHKPLWKRLQ
jgi:hypothetical protein